MVALPLRVGGQFGVLDASFGMDVRPGLMSVVGTNNSGKSHVLQLIFRAILNSGGVDQVVFVPPDRDLIQPNMQPQGMKLQTWNNQLNGNVPLAYHPGATPDRSMLFRLVMDHKDLIQQFVDLKPLLARFGFQEPELREDQTLFFGDQIGGVQGKGLRAILPILAATTDPRTEVLLVDEPETALEPRIQRMLRDHLAEWAGSSKAVVVATHSHLFLNRQEPSLNVRIERNGSTITATPAASTQDLGDITFRLLGSSVEDLFFPGNFLIVEGVSDQVICQRVLELLGAPSGAVKVFAAGGITEVPEATKAIERTLRTLLAGSPYGSRIVCLIDRPTHQDQVRKVEEFSRVLQERLVVLTEESIEEAIPPEIYQRAGLERDEVLKELQRLHSDWLAQRKFKAETSTRLSSVLRADDLENIPDILRAAVLALDATNSDLIAVD